MARGRKWAKGAAHPQERGALRRYVRRKYGSGGFTQRGTLKVDVLRKIVHQSGVWARRAQFALNINRGKRKG